MGDFFDNAAEAWNLILNPFATPIDSDVPATSAGASATTDTGIVGALSSSLSNIGASISDALPSSSIFPSSTSVIGGLVVIAVILVLVLLIAGKVESL